MTLTGWLPVLEMDTIVVHRVVASAAALDTLASSRGDVLRLAPDEALVLGAGIDHIDDPWAIIETDTSWCATQLRATQIEELFARHASWAPPSARQTFAQGRFAGLAVKAYWENGEVTLLCPAAYCQDLQLRLGAAT